VRSAVPGGVDLVLEAVGGDTLHRCLGLLAPYGRAGLAELTGWFGTGKLRAVAGATLPLAEVSRAHQLLEERSVLGRLLLVP
jgi:NADPH2:quinone reductase